MRVLIGMPDRESLGGPAACEPPFVEELRRLGVEVGEETYVYGDKLSGTGLARRVRRVVSTARRIRRRLRAGRFDVAHLNTSFDARALLRDAATVPLLGRAGARLFLKFHGSDGELLRTTNPALRRMGRRLLDAADGVGVLSSEERENFTRAGVDGAKVFVVKNVVERTFPREAGDLAARAGLDEGAPVLLFIARFIPAKGLLDVVRACAVLRDRGARFALLCVGDGPARADAEREVERLDLRGRVRFTGFVPEGETGEFYAGSTALVFPTYHYEGFPMTVFYAAAAGLPIITTRIRAAADYLREPDNCLWVEPRSPGALADRIARLLGEPGTRAAMRRNNAELARSFTAPRVAPEYVEIYNRLLARGRARGA